MLLSWKAALASAGPFSEYKWDRIPGLKHLLLFSLILSLFHDKVNLPVQSVPPQGYNEVQLAATSLLVTVLLKVLVFETEKAKGSINITKFTILYSLQSLQFYNTKLLVLLLFYCNFLQNQLLSFKNAKYCS